MGVYRCDLLRPNKTIVSIEMLLCEDDGDAVRKARQLLATSDHAHDVEVWQRERRVHLSNQSRF
jgi:hypothetical protein